MAFSLITGGSGAGKTEYIYKKVIDWSMKEPQRQFFVIVPEQRHAGAEGYRPPASAPGHHEY